MKKIIERMTNLNDSLAVSGSSAIKFISLVRAINKISKKQELVKVKNLKPDLDDSGREIFSLLLPFIEKRLSKLTLNKIPEIESISSFRVYVSIKELAQLKSSEIVPVLQNFILGKKEIEEEINLEELKEFSKDHLLKETFNLTYPIFNEYVKNRIKALSHQ